MKISPSRMMYPIAIASVSCSFIYEPIGPYAAWYVTQNGYMESYGWTATQLNMWSETSVLLPVGLMTILLAIFVVPRFLPDEPDVPTTMVAGRALKKQEPLSPVREFLGYGIFIAGIVCLMLGFSSWKVTLIGAIAVVFSGVLTEREAIDNMNMSTVLLYVGVTVLGEGLSQTGAAEMLGNWIAGVLSGVSNGYVIGAAFYIVAFIMTSLLYNRAVTTVLVPLTVITCGSMGCDPRGPIILCALASMSSLITPLSTAVVPMAMNAGGYSAKTVFKVGLIPRHPARCAGRADCDDSVPGVRLIQTSCKKFEMRCPCGQRIFLRPEAKGTRAQKADAPRRQSWYTGIKRGGCPGGAHERPQFAKSGFEKEDGYDGFGIFGAARFARPAPLGGRGRRGPEDRSRDGGGHPGRCTAAEGRRAGADHRLYAGAAGDHPAGFSARAAKSRCGRAGHSGKTLSAQHPGGRAGAGG